MSTYDEWLSTEPDPWADEEYGCEVSTLVARYLTPFVKTKKQHENEPRLEDLERERLELVCPHCGARIRYDEFHICPDSDTSEPIARTK